MDAEKELKEKIKEELERGRKLIPQYYYEPTPEEMDEDDNLTPEEEARLAARFKRWDEMLGFKKPQKTDDKIKENNKDVK